MTTRITDAVQNAACNAVVDSIDGASAGHLKVYTGTQPADADSAATGTLLADFTLANPAFGAAAAGVATASAISNVTASATGTAGWFRVETSGGTAIFDGACRATADTDNGEELVFDNTSITSGQTVAISSLTYTISASE